MLYIYLFISAAAIVLSCTVVSPWLLVPMFIAGCIVMFLLHVIALAIVNFRCRLIKEVDRYRTPKALYWFAAETCKLICLWCGQLVRVRGLEKLDPSRKYLFVGNHVSNLDPIAGVFILKKFNTLFISKPENFKMPFIGQLIRAIGFMPIDRDNPRNALRTIMDASDVLVNGDRSVFVYPEGTRNKSEEKLLEFHNGVFKIAQRANVPVAVLVTRGIRFGAKFLSRVDVEVLGVIETEKVCAMKTNEIGEEVKKQLLEAL